MRDKQPKTDSFGIRDAFYLTLGILAIGISWREWSSCRLAIEEVREEQKTLLAEIRVLQNAVTALDAKLGETPTVTALPVAATPKAPHKPRRKKTDENTLT